MSQISHKMFGKHYCKRNITTSEYIYQQSLRKSQTPMFWQLQEIELSTNQEKIPQNAIHIPIKVQQHLYKTTEEWTPHPTSE